MPTEGTNNMKKAVFILALALTLVISKGLDAQSSPSRNILAQSKNIYNQYAELHQYDVSLRQTKAGSDAEQNNFWLLAEIIQAVTTRCYYDSFLVYAIPSIKDDERLVFTRKIMDDLRDTKKRLNTAYAQIQILQPYITTKAAVTQIKEVNRIIRSTIDLYEECIPYLQSIENDM